MGTQFLLSLIGGVVAGAGLGFIVARYGYKWYKKEKLDFSGEMVTIVSTLVVLGAISTYKLAESSFHYAKVGGNAVLEAGQEAISGTIKYFSVAVLEGVGKTYDHFEEKWDKEKVTSFKELDLRILSSTKKLQHDKVALHLTLEVTNRGQESVDFKELVKHKLLLLKGEGEEYYPVTFNGATDERMLIPSATTIVQEIDVLVHDNNFPTMLITPFQKLELK